MYYVPGRISMAKSISRSGRIQGSSSRIHVENH